MLNHRISAFCDDNNLLSDEQNGFRRGRSCDDHIFTLSSIVQNYINQKSDVFCAFVDLEKTFDWVERDLLYLRLLRLGIHGKIYSKTLSCIRLNSLLTDWFETESGVKQGDNLSPTLFSIYIDDLAKEIKDLNLGLKVGDEIISILLYTDDMVLVSDNETNL